MVDAKREEVSGKAQGGKFLGVWTNCDYLMPVSERWVRVSLWRAVLVLA
jgi:hypothetical protein